MKKLTSYLSRSLQFAAVAGMVGFGAMAPKAFGAEDYEWEAGEGINEDEWYDPTDWFDGNNVESNDVSSIGYDDSYYYDGFWNGYDYYGDYGYDYVGYDPNTIGYDYYYQWSPVNNTWSEVSGTEAESNKQREQAQQQSKDKKKKEIDKKSVVTMRGTIDNVTKVKTKGAQKEHTYAVLKTSKGKSVLVDFGPKADLTKVKLEKGKKIQVRGPRAKFNGKYIVVAQQVSEVKADKSS